MMAKAFPLYLFAGLCFLGGCSIFSSSDRSQLTDAQALWARAEIADYNYLLSVACECLGGRYDVEVRNQTVVTATPLDGQPDGSLGEKTVDDLFSIIVDAIARNAVELDVTYDGGLGYPLSISIDYDRNVIDDEIFYTVEDFERVN